MVVVGHQSREVEAAARRASPHADFRFALQEHIRGTGDAARSAMAAIPKSFDGDVLIAYGDMPRVRSDTLRAFLSEHRRRGAALSLISVTLDDPAEYGRVVRDAAGAVDAIVEAKDASPAQRAIREINTGFYLASRRFLDAALARYHARQRRARVLSYRPGHDRAGARSEGRGVAAATRRRSSPGSIRARSWQRWKLKSVRQ